MNKHLFTLLIAVGSFLTSTNVFAQKTKAEIYGLGRAVVELDGMTDTTSTDQNQGSGGYTLLDLGFKVQKDEILKADMIMRIRNEYGGFFQNGQSFDFRQLRLEGVVGGALKYAIGDLDMVLTPYTLYNSDLEFHKYESGIFALKRDVINYEQFYTDENTWRTQGVDLSFALKFAKAIERLGFRAFGNRIVASNNISTPDRWIFGGRMDIKQSKYLTLGVNALSMRDMASTVTSSAFEYKNDVYTADVLFDYNEMEKLRLNIGGEFGVSNYDSKRNSDDTTVAYDDGFYEAFVKLTYKPLNIYLRAGYKSVGAEFSSPTAQTRRINDFGSLLIYSNYTDQVSPRNMAIQDRYSQEYGIYGKTFATNYARFNPIFGNINPYGEATANRQGLDIELGTKDTNFYEVSVAFQLKEEVAIENPDNVNNSTEKRKFTGIEAGGKLYVNQFLNFEKEISIIGGIRQETTKRTSAAVPIDLTSTQLDFGLDIEPIRRLHVLVGYKSLSAKGNEYENQRNEFNSLGEALPNRLDFDLKNSVLAWGLIYDFNFNAQFSVQGNYQQWRNKYDYAEKGGDYYGTTPYDFDMTQVYINYTQRF